MAGVHILKFACLVEHAVEHGRVAVSAAAIAQIAVHEGKDSGKRKIHRGCSKKYPLEQGRKQRRRYPLAGNIAYEKPMALAIQLDHVETISPHRITGERGTGHRDV